MRLRSQGSGSHSPTLRSGPVETSDFTVAERPEDSIAGERRIERVRRMSRRFRRLKKVNVERVIRLLRPAADRFQASVQRPWVLPWALEPGRGLPRQVRRVGARNCVGGSPVDPSS